MNEFERDLHNAKVHDPKIGIKIGNLQRYAKSLAKKLYYRIQQNGIYENAGQHEFLEWDNRRNYYNINDYQLVCDLKEMTQWLFYAVGNNQIGLEDIKEFSYK